MFHTCFQVNTKKSETVWSCGFSTLNSIEIRVIRPNGSAPGKAVALVQEIELWTRGLTTRCHRPQPLAPVRLHAVAKNLGGELGHKGQCEGQKNQHQAHYGPTNQFTFIGARQLHSSNIVSNKPHHCQSALTPADPRFGCKTRQPRLPEPMDRRKGSPCSVTCKPKRAAPGSYRNHKNETCPACYAFPVLTCGLTRLDGVFSMVRHGLSGTIHHPYNL